MHLKESKCKELRISFSTTNVEFEPITVNNKEIEVVPSATLLGLSISNDFKRHTHIENVCKKVSSRLYFLRQLKRAKLPSNDLLLFYVTCIRPVAEYACEVFHDSLPKYLSDDLEKLQKRACRIILPGHFYENALGELGLTSLADRRQNLTNKLFKTIVNDPQNKLHHLLPTLNPVAAPGLRILGGGHLRGKLIFWGGKIEFLKRYCYLPMPLSQDFCPPPPQEIRPPLKRGRYS